MSNDSLLTPVSSDTHSTHVEYPDGSQPTSSLTQQESKQQATQVSQASVVPTDEKSIILGLIEYLKRGAEYSGENQAQSDWFLFCSDWVKSKYEASGLTNSVQPDEYTSPSGPWFNQ